ncbi:VanZ family protein [Pigmentiphaga sp. NML080357]|uniref:VanZ family protein n=1 Tax=Pigmentiphaga sp. NML080357 TaxID=2008675 RepID=UPI000B407FEF|nr:VanZ family protein [Pigmentiphaga sp. NML080357]OVZ59719.1 VanZ family protein [Pigmentiphaga sp. NML080357]
MISRLTAFGGWKPLFWATALGILVLSLLPPATPMPTTGWDKTNHLLGFATLAALARFAYPGPAWPRLPGLLAFGALIEVLQSLTPNRSAEWTDLIADGLGIAIGWGLAWFATAGIQRRA